MNTLESGGNELVPVNYSDLLTRILAVLKNQQTQNPFRVSGDRPHLIIDIDAIACQIASQPVENPLGASANKARSASVHFSANSREDFSEKVQKIRDALQQQLESALHPMDSQQYIQDLITDLSAFQGEVRGLGFTYPFGQYGDLKKQRLSLHQTSASNSPLLKFHKLTITVENAQNFNQNLQVSLQNFIDIQFASESEGDRQHLNDILQDLVTCEQSDLYHLQRLMDTEALAKLQREAKIRYLEFLHENLAGEPDSIYLEDLIRRLRLIEDYINNPEQADGHYEVNYAGKTVNYRDLFSRADAFDMLPIIPIISGYLGETTDESLDKHQFIFGLKLKFGGKVQSQGGQPNFDYYLSLLDSTSKEHQAGLENTFKSQFFVEKLLKILLLYIFVFACKKPGSSDYVPDSEYQPKDFFESIVLPRLKGSDETQKQGLLQRIRKNFETYGIKEKINRLKLLLRKAIKRSHPARSYPLHINVRQSILEKDISAISGQGSFFKSGFQNNLKRGLKYITVSEPTIDPKVFCSLRATIQISDIQYFSTTDQQSFSMEYTPKGIDTIPILVVPQEKECERIYQNNFGRYKLIKFTYDYQRLREQILKNLESRPAFVYRVTFGLLAYTVLKILFNIGKPLFIPILRLHLSDKQNPKDEETFLLSCFAVLSHLLNEEHRSNSQGFCIKDCNLFKVRNALSSLYSVLPKTFHLPDTGSESQLDKLAIIIVSSRESDRSKTGNYKESNLLGQIIGVERQANNKIRVKLVRTFSDNCDSQNLFSNPSVLIDEVNKLYGWNYKHFMYIAKSPYSSTLNMTRNPDDELFFMSKPLMQALKGNREDIKIYPMFFDQYSVVKFALPKSSSLYIQDTLELTSLVEDPGRKAAVFFNLFNGISLPGEDRYYNGVISYATLLNIYEGILDDQDLRMGLIYDNALKNELLQYLTLFHFSRYEAAPRKGQNISIKLNPYQNIIGDYSVGALSIFNHTNSSKINFNLLAFLTEVKKALNVKKS